MGGHLITRINNQKGSFIAILFAWLLVAGFAHSLYAKENQQFEITEINVKVHPIFDLETNDSWLYSMANQLHIDSKPQVIKRILPIKVGDRVTQQDIAEAERVLRQHGYLREAKINMEVVNSEQARLTVQTWENWTLFPTVDLNRQGGETEYSYGIKDDNLFGLGLAANVAYFAEQDRSGHILSLSSDAISDRHLRVALTLADNSDGEQIKISLNKPFYKLADRHSVGIAVDSHEREVSIDANELLVNRFASDKQFGQLYFGYSSGKTDKGIFRWIGDVTHEKYDFDTLLETSQLPQNRDLTYPWLAFEYQQDQFKKTKNLYLLEKTEDVQLGWYQYLKLGFNLESSYRDDAIIWQLYSGYFGIWDQQHWYRYGLSGHGVHSSKEVTNAYYALFYEHFYRVNDSRTWYLKANYRAAENPYIDRPLSLGGETGLRGYPMEYQHGNKQWLLNLEKRFYPQINIAQLLDIAFVGFVDVGRNYGETPYLNQEAIPNAGKIMM